MDEVKLDCQFDEDESYLSEDSSLKNCSEPLLDDCEQTFGFDANGTKLEADEEIVEVGIMKLRGFQYSLKRDVVFWFIFICIMIGLGYISWLFTEALYQDDKVGHFLGFLALSLILVGSELLFIRWYPGKYVELTSHLCPLKTARILLINTSDGESTPCYVGMMERVVEVGVSSDEGVPETKVVPTRGFTFRHLTFCWNARFQRYKLTTATYPNLSTRNRTVGLLETDVKNRAKWYGPNLIDIEIPSSIVLLTREILHPFFWFQMFSVVLWFFENYFYYATVILILTLSTAYFNLTEMKRNLTNLRNMALHFSWVEVVRRNEVKKVMSDDLVPGDLVRLKTNTVIPFDGILISGECIVNESMLTGESVPITKIAFRETSVLQGLSNPIPRISLLYSGTSIVQAKSHEKRQETEETEEFVSVIVWRTGFQTTKGRLVKSILFPPPGHFVLYQDGFKFLMILAVVALVGFAISVWNAMRHGEDMGEVFLGSLDLVTIAVPPALPTTLVIGITYALQRLNKIGFFCISPPRINVAGSVNLVCFDKTGTITETGLDMNCVIPVSSSDQDQGVVFESNIAAGEIKMINTSTTKNPDRDSLLMIMATCHTVRSLKMSTSGESSLVGDPLDVKMFETTNWEIAAKSEEPFSALVTVKPPSDSRFTPLVILKVYEFRSELQRMTCICLRQRPGDHKEATIQLNQVFTFMKGAPEVILSMCRPETVPAGTSTLLQSYTKQGFRVLATASGPFPSSKDEEEASTFIHSLSSLSQATVEKETVFSFQGFVILENRIKPESAPTIQVLQTAGLGSLIITGDHALTAIHVGRTCGILPAINADGDTKEGDKSVIIADVPDLAEKSLQSLSWTDVVFKDDLTGKVLTPEQLRQLGLWFDSKSQNGSPEDQGEKRQGVRRKLDYPRKADTPLMQSASFDQVQSSTAQPVKPGTPPFITAIRNHRGHSLVLTGNAFEILVHQFGPTASANSSSRIVVTDEGRHRFLLNVLDQVVIAARFQPNQKAKLIELLSSCSGYVTLFCGDGANDCGALKAADVGLSLCPDAEASIAAPFTSTTTNISSVIPLIQEGRAAIVTSIQCFKFIALYALIQWVTSLQSYLIQTELSDFQFLFVDLWVVLPIAATMGYTKAYPKLSLRRPLTSLMTWPFFASVFGQFLICVAFEIGLAQGLRQQPWYEPQPVADDDGDDPLPGMENSIVYAFSNFQYIFIALYCTLFNLPFHSWFFRCNPYYLACLFLSFFAAGFQLWNPYQSIGDLMVMVGFPDDYRWSTVMLLGANFVVGFMLEFAIEEGMKREEDKRIKEEEEKEEGEGRGG